ncbi:MAG: ECF transporter S component [Clostridiales bacterium]|jgi:riboflavin transporter FmnP|uniref:ECF transporter S component n=2 Tax=Aminipila sp. TaxID=2060095 RepID=UPI001E0BB6C4|nr:ECF transporter S component [Aminipila sp.]MBE6034983.1 ECF transporter S component [Clostridiales bacterium]
MTSQNKTVRLAKMGMLVAISVVLVSIVRFPIFPAVAFLEYDPADIPIIIGTFAFGPIAGLMIVIITSILQGVTVSAASGLYGIIMHILATGAFVLVAGLLYKGNKSKREAVIALVAGVAAMTIVMVIANMIVTPLFTGWPLSAVMEVMPFIVAFNLLKAGVNSIITFFLYKRISPFLHR